MTAELRKTAHPELMSLLDEFEELHGISKPLYLRIIEGRPFEEIADLDEKSQALTRRWEAEKKLQRRVEV